MISAKESMENPRECVEINALGTLNVLRAAADAGVRKLVFASSAAVYGDDPPVPTVETATPKAEEALMRSPNWMVSTTAKCLLAKAGLTRRRFVSSMFSDPGRIPRAPTPRQCPHLCESRVRGEPLTIFGDGEQSRDFIYVKDAVSALAFAAEKARCHRRVQLRLRPSDNNQRARSPNSRQGGFPVADRASSGESGRCAAFVRLHKKVLRLWAGNRSAA